MELLKVTEVNKSVYLNLAQSYEGEFSAITEKKPNEHGLFELDTEIENNVMGFILYIEEAPAGIIAIADKGNNQYEICEFYIVPYFRNKAWGKKFSHAVWNMFPGMWEIKQISGAEYATLFWRKVIRSFHQTEFMEDEYNDPYWGVVTRQRFEVNQK